MNDGSAPGSLPRKLHGRSRYCRVCFGFVDKSLPWLAPEVPRGV